MIGICTDTSALLPSEVARRHGVEVVPIPVSIDGGPFDEDAHSIDDFYALMDAGTATTSQPNPAEFAEAYERLAGRGARQILSIHLDERLSGTTASAELAATGARLPVHVVDTRTVSFGVAASVLAAIDELELGSSVERVVAAVTRFGASMRNAFVAAGGPGGRVPQSAGFDVFTTEGGETRALASCSSADEASGEIARLTLGSGARIRAAVGHAGAVAGPEADALADLLVGSPNVSGVERYRVGPAVGAHTGPWSFGAFWWPIASS